MKIEVFFEPEIFFTRRVDKIDGTFRFDDFLKLLDEVNSSKSDDDSDQNQRKFIVTKDSSVFQNNHICVIRLSDFVGYKSFVFERMDLYLEIFERMGVEKLLINNPTRILMSNLENQSGLLVHNINSFKKININKINSLSEKLDQQIIGQEKAKLAIYRKLIIQHIRTGNKPLVLMFYGNPGIGKTEVAKLMASTLFKTKTILREQMSMTAGNASIEYFKATGHTENSFSKELLNRKSNILLLDEFALAPEYIQTAFFQLFDEGKYIDQNFSVDMRNSIIICTSNFTSKKQMKKSISPALYSRFDAVIPFVDFTLEEKLEVSDKIIENYVNSGKMKSQYVELMDIDKVKDRVHQMVKTLSNFRSIRNLVEDIIADELIKISEFKK